MYKSSKQIHFENKILDLLTGNALEMTKSIFEDEEIQALQDYCNNVSIKRLGFNDHGPVHMRKTTLNAIVMFKLLSDNGIKFNLETEGLGKAEDSLIGVILAALFHDFGMSIARENHELMSVQLALPYIKKYLEPLYSQGMLKTKMAVQSIAVEGIFGHMGTQRIHSLEAGLVLIGDGADMEQGRARIPMLLASDPKPGDIHRTSANAIKRVRFEKGETKPIEIRVTMTASVGFFQIEEVLFPKILKSPVKPYIELYAGVEGREFLKYL
ncbi:MAG: phosphohydrolase [Candidatus Cloacimonadales bacterium]